MINVSFFFCIISASDVKSPETIPFVSLHNLQNASQKRKTFSFCISRREFKKKVKNPAEETSRNKKKKNLLLIVRFLYIL